MESCFDLHNPKTFKEWALSAQRNHKVWLKKQATRGSFNTTQPKGQPSPILKGQFYWRRGNQGGGQEQGQTNGSRSKGQWHGSNSRQLGPIDPNALDTSVAVQKVYTKEEKLHYRKEGWCFECAKIGHLARLCPDRKPCAKAVTDATPKEETTTPASIEEFTNGETLALAALKLNDKAREAFIKRIVMAEEEMGFLVAWMQWWSFGPACLNLCT